MKLRQIITNRKRYSWPSYHLIYEWEDDIAESLDLSLVYDPKIFTIHRLRKFPGMESLITHNRPTLEFCMNAKEFKDKCFIGSSSIPCIIDFYLTENDLGNFYKALSKTKIVLISSKEAYDYLKDHDCPLNIAHWPLSLSGRYSISPDTKFEKKYDLVIMGRPNPVLNSFLDKYVESHPDFVYVYRKLDNGVFSYFTNTGEELGSDFESRDKYISLMRSARIGLYSTPGIDDSTDRTKGFSQVTPRFLELISSGCHIIARYTKNSDTDFYELEKFSQSIDSYQQFEIAMDNARSKEVDMEMYSEYLAKHYTSVRAENLNRILSTL